ncbi:MAG TPA: hypothetical protein VE825_02410 [Terriglobales bacterium]|jgi:hypothetical protein|nr:hypothetical protein [Terriglobales bacterium]
MKRAGWLLAIFLVGLASSAAFAQEPRVMPQLVVQARFVYVTSYDGPPWSGDLLPQDRQAIVDVQDSLMKWGKYILVYRPEEADLILIVQKRGNEDVLAVYDNKPFNGNPLWRGMQQGGLDAKEMGLMTRFQRGVEKAEAAK